MTNLTDVDILVIGSGAAGLSAAIAARQSGAQRVLVAEGEGVVGGSSRLSGGLMMGAGTRYQRALGIQDSWEQLFHDYMTLNQWQVETAVVQRLTQRAGEAVEWLPAEQVEASAYDTPVVGWRGKWGNTLVSLIRTRSICYLKQRRCTILGRWEYQTRF